MTIVFKFVIICLFFLQSQCQNTSFKDVKVKLISTKQDTKSELFVASVPTLKFAIIGDAIDVVKIDHQNIPVLFENSVRDLKNIKVISLSANRMERIEPNAFQNLGLLEALNLSSNSLSKIHDGTLNTFDVKFLFLGHNKIHHIDSHAFNDLYYLHSIDLRHNRLRFWNPKWFQGTNVKSINVAYNYLQELPEDAFKFVDDLGAKRMHHLIFNHNELQHLHMFSMPKLHHLGLLDLSYNYLETIFPGVFHSIEEIGTLNLAFNRLVYLDKELFKFTKVRFLNLKHNFLSVVQEELFWVPNIINLNNNRLDFVAEGRWNYWKLINGSSLQLEEFKDV